MKHTKLICLAGLALTLLAPSLQGRTYIVDRGDTWESVARKWGVHTDELKASNAMFTDLYVGVELELPENSTSEPLSNYAIASYAIDDRSIERAEKALADRNYSSARSYLTGAMNRRGHTTARLTYLYATSCEGTKNYVEALESYGKAAELFNNGDRTMDSQQILALNSDMERVLPLAQEEEQRKEEQRREMRRRREAERKAEAEKKQRRREFWGNLGMGLLQGVAQGLQAASYGNGYGYSGYMPSYNNSYSGYNSSYSPTESFAAIGVSLPPALDYTKWDPSAFQIQVTYDAYGNPMYSSPGAAKALRDMNAAVYDCVSSGAAKGVVSNSLLQQAALNSYWGNMDATYLETPHYYVPDNGESSSATTTDGSNPREDITFEEVTCKLCEGTGWIPNSKIATMGLTFKKYCNTCKKYVDGSHGHDPCPSCQGKGKTSRRSR